jgi:hypothetical protein
VATDQWTGSVDKETDTDNGMDMKWAKSGYTSFMTGVLTGNVSKYLYRSARLNS